MATSCAKENNPQISFDYDSLYSSAKAEPYGEIDKGSTNRASHGYTLNSEQGHNDWFYLYERDAKYSTMKFDYSQKAFKGNSSYISNDIMRSVVGENAVRKFVVSVDGKVTVYGNYKCSDKEQKALKISILHGRNELFSNALSAGDIVGKYFELEIEVKAGDELYFILIGDGKISFNPTITYEGSQNSSLYHLTDFNECYGDVFPYYDFASKKLYMGFLWSRDARLGKYSNALELSSNMLTFENIAEENNFEIWEKYKQEYRKEWIFNCNNFIDTNKYKFGIRDHMLYFDDEKQRYLLIAGCYYEFDSNAQTSDLVIYESKDPFALEWTRVGNVVQAGYNRNLPECPSLMKIGNRWYSFVSVAYNTAHQVGPLQYWVGDEGVDCMDVNWQEKSYSYLDGEDLCATRPTRVGEKVYMWGWIPERYDTMPWSPWGGYLNLPREIVQLQNGNLGGRLDPALTKLVNFGNIYSLNKSNYVFETGNGSFNNNSLSMSGENNYVKLKSNMNRNFVTFNVNMKESNCVGYIMKQGDKEYQVVIQKEDNKTYLRVLSPNDSSHKVNSYIEIADENIFDVKIVIDGEFIEFFVNDEYALTAHTAMTGTSYDAYIYSSNEAVFKDVKINKLIPYSDI